MSNALHHEVDANQRKQRSQRSAPVKRGIWFLGNATWVVGLIDRSVATLMDGSLSIFDAIQLFITLFFFAGWILLRPGQEIR